jgi:hypothetical protein
MKFGVTISALLLSSLAFGQNTTPSEPSIFPMAKGTSWVYSARVKFGKAGTDVAGTRTLRWTVTVIDTIEKDDIAAALLKGGPWDLAWYEPTVKPQEHLIVRMGTTYYLLHDDAAATLAEIKAGKTGDLKDRLADDIWFQLPMAIADNYCSPEAEERAPMNCWSVEKITTTHSLKVPGLKASPENTEYLLSFMSNPDTEMVTLVPGVGILSWWYQHHGTVAEASLKLLEFHAPGTTSARKPATRVRSRSLASQH